MLPLQTFANLDASLLEQEINIDYYKILLFDRNRQGGGVACYIRYDLTYNILTYIIIGFELGRYVFPCEIENIFFEVLLPNSKPIIVGTLYRPPCQNTLLELLNSNMNKINSVDNEIYILGDFNINLFLNDSYVLEKNNIFNSKTIPNDVKSYHEFCTFFGLKQLIKVPTKTTTSRSTIIDHILASYPEGSPNVVLQISFWLIISLFPAQGRFLGLKGLHINKYCSVHSNITQSF